MRRFQELKRETEVWKPSWRELNEFILPWSGRFLQSDTDIPDIRRGEYVHNSTVFHAVKTAASGLHGGLTSPSRPWFEIVHPDKDLMEQAEVKNWVYDLQMNERTILSKSNFYAEIQRLYYEALTYGTGAMLMERDTGEDGTIVRFRTLTCGEYYIAHGAKLRVNTLYRRFAMTALQMREEYGEGNLSIAVKDALRQRNYSAVFYIIQAIQPYGTFTGKTHPEWKFESVHFEEGCGDPDGDKLLRESGYRAQPFVVVRWDTIGDDVYGYGPGHMCLSDVRQLQTQERAYINAVNWIADPAWLVSDSMRDGLSRGDIKPGAILTASASEAQHLFRPLMQPSFDFNNIRLKIQDVEGRINSMFYNDLFTMVANRQREMTATEVQQLVEEKATVLGPVFETFLSEIFDPILERVYDLMQNDFAIVPPAPDAIANSDLKIEYVSILAQAQKQAGLSNLNHFLAIAGQVVAQFPDSIIKINSDEVIDTLATISPVNPSIVRSDDEVAAIRRQAQEQAQQAQLMENVPGLAGAAKDLSETQPGPDNGLGMLMGVEGGA